MPVDQIHTGLGLPTLHTRLRLDLFPVKLESIKTVMEETTAVSFILEKVETTPLKLLAGSRQLKSIERDLKTIHEFLQNPADFEPATPSRELLRKIRQTAYDAEDAIDRVAARAEKQRFLSSLIAFLFGLNHTSAIAEVRRKAASICRRIDKEHADQERFSLKKTASLLSRGDENAVRSFRKDAGKDESVLGFAEEEKILQRKLLEAGNQVVSLVGMGGLGKTSLASRVFNHKSITEHFAYRTWVSVHNKYTIRDLLETIIKECQVPITLHQHQIQEEEELRNAVSHWSQQQGNRYLIVLDDVWDLNLWDQINKAFPGNASGSRILITSRNKSACPNSNPPHQLKPMSPHDSWELLMEKLRSANMEEVLESHKDRILKKCCGLPLAIVSFAKGLVSATHHLPNILDDDDVTAWLPPPELNSLAMSYNELPLRLRRCFLYLGLFPRDFDIPVRRLYRLWLAEGFADQNSETGPSKSPENLVEEYLQYLADRHLIQIKYKSDDSPKTCRMPGILRDIFLPKAEEIGLFYIHRNSNSAGAASQLPVRRVVEHYLDIKEFPHSEIDLQHVRSYISFNEPKNGNDMPAVGIESFVSEVIRVQHYGILKVLDLEHVYKPKLPEELGNLYYLRYLGLRWTFLDSLPSSVGDLSHLETLDIKHTYITSLPNSIWKIKKLRHLLLNEIRLDMTLHRKVMTPPTQLQTLWGLYVDKKSPVKNGLDRLVNLKKLGLTCHPDSIEEVTQWIEKLSGLETLKLRCKDNHERTPLLSLDPFEKLDNLTDLYLLGKLQKLPASNKFPPKLKVLTLSISELEDDPMPELSQLPHLKILKLYANSYLGETMICPKGGFSSLQRLRLWMLCELKTWTLEEGAMQNLRQVEIRCCNNLKELPDILLKRSALERIVFTNMEELAKDLKAKKQKDKSIKVTVKDRTLDFDNIAV